jgi:hypothetical protein
VRTGRSLSVMDVRRVPGSVWEMKNDQYAQSASYGIAENVVWPNAPAGVASKARAVIMHQRRRLPGRVEDRVVMCASVFIIVLLLQRATGRAPADRLGDLTSDKMHRFGQFGQVVAGNRAAGSWPA